MEVRHVSTLHHPALTKRYSQAPLRKTRHTYTPHHGQAAATAGPASLAATSNTGCQAPSADLTTHGHFGGTPHGHFEGKPQKTRAARRHLLLFPERTLWGIWPQDLRTLWGERGQVLTQGRQHTNTLPHRIGRLFPYRTAQAKPEKPSQGDLRTLWGIERRTPRTHGGIGRPTARTLWGIGLQNLRTLRGKFNQNPRTL